ncbi:MAG TPA: polyphosphate kinase 2 family protein [Bellilinea sp.]|nr:polyphosphate kinase 2 family protein [Bellilinea sp.]
MPDALHRVRPNETISLKDINPNSTGNYKGDKNTAKDDLIKLNNRLEELQELLYAENRHRVLIVIQAMDSGGKDGVIRHVFDGVNPQGVKVASFKVPTPEELAHDYLWRIHKQVPGNGEITIFNRSHYEDVLVVRVHSLVPKARWEKRFDHIVNFEKMLAQEGTTILKFFLHIDLDEQKERLQARLDDPHKQWKFNPGDLKERALWDKYMQAYEDVINKTSTREAPWFIIPANKKWYRNIAISRIIINALEGMKMQYPKPTEDYSKIVIE